MYNFQKGDILAFKVEERWISKAIAWVTDSDIGHVAMIHQDNVMVEMGPTGTMRSLIAEGRGEAAYRLRLRQPRDPQPLIDAADVYLSGKVFYDFPSLVLLGIALVYRHIRPSTRIYRVVDQIVNIAVCEIDKLINRLLEHPNAMMCSQFVYQIYLDCGEAYRLRLKDALLQQPNTLAVLAQACHENVFELRASDADIEALCKELLEAAQEDSVDLQAELPERLLGAAAHLTGQLERIAQLTNIPMEALLVMPADIAYHAENLERIDEVLVERTGRA